MVKLSRDGILYFELLISALIFVSMTFAEGMLPFLSPGLAVMDLVMAVLLISLVLVCSFEYGKERKRGAASMLPHLLFLGMATAYLVTIVFFIPSTYSYSDLMIRVLTIDTLFFTAFLPLFFLAFFGVYLWRDKRRTLVKSLAAVAILLVLLSAILILFYFKTLIVSYVIKDDEELIALHGAIALINGTHAYGTSYANAIYQNPNVGYTVTTDNKIMGFMDYPALFFLVVVPFCLLAQPTLANFENLMMPLQSSIFIFILLLSLAFSLKRKDLLKPKFTMLAFLILAMLNISSLQTYLMIALLIVAYAMIDSKYAWVVLGLAISIQEELWLPMLLLVAYSANNQGIRRGAKNAVGAIFVFILVNGYFIIQSPSSFFSSVFSTLGGSFLPNGTSSAGFELSRAFPILLSTYSQLFEVTALLMVFLLLYWNRKELIPLFSMVPFLVTVHSISSYYVTFLFLLIFAFCTWDKKEVGQIERIMRKDKRIVYASVAAFFLVLAAIICLSHAAYVRDFNVSMGGAQLTLDWTNSTSIYRTTLNYEGLNNRTLYVYAISSAQGAGISVRGFMNDGIIPGAKAACGSYDCMLNINKITLPQNASSYPLTVIANWDNKTVPTRYFAVELYNGDHFVSGSPEQNFSTFSPS